MSNERQPLLSDDSIELILPSMPQEDLFWAEFGGKMIRDHYESLITTGKLRVAEECSMRATSFDGTSDCVTLKCTKCGKHYHGNEPAPFYPVAPREGEFCFCGAKRR